MAGPSHLDLNEFESDNQDPFSNMELRTIDDLKELSDVLQNVSSGTIITNIYYIPLIIPCFTRNRRITLSLTSHLLALPCLARR